MTTAPMSLSASDLLQRPLALAARLPWWAALLSAGAAYALLAPLARLRPPTPEAGLVAGALAQLLLSLAAIAQVLVPLVLLIVAAISAYAAWRRYELFSAAADDLAGDLLRGLTREESGLLLTEAFRRLGYSLGEPMPGGAARLRLVRNGRTFLVDFGHWKAWQAETSVVEKLHTAVTYTGAHGGVAVSSGRFSADAGRLARALDIGLIDGQRLRELIRSGWDPFVQRGQAEAPSPATGTTPPAAASTGDEDTKTAVGESLAALIRAEARHEGLTGAEATLSPWRNDLRPDERDGPEPRPLTGWGDLGSEPAVPRRRRRPRPGLAQILDVLGMLVAVALLLGGWRWLAALPAAPEGFPLGRLQVDPAPPVERATTSAASGSQRTRPLGEFHFGPAGETPPSAADSASVDEPPAEAGLMPKLSVWELEAAFNASYIPPPECANWQSNADMARCGNHRMRTLRAFIEGGGRLLPAMRGESLRATSRPETARTEQASGSSGRAAPTGDWRWGEDTDPQPIPPGPFAAPFDRPEITAPARPDPPNTPASAERPARAPTWREEQARRDAGDWGREQDRLFVSPEDAEGEQGEWLRR